MKLWIVNVLEGVIFISTTTTTFNKVEIKEVCQCPERGDLHFYRRKILIIILIILSVNALKGATFISTICTNLRRIN